jgi:cytochrome P450
MSQAHMHEPVSPLHYEPLQLHDDPYPLYRRLRDEAPLFYNAERGCWVLSRYDDVQAAARDWETFSLAEGNDLDDSAELFAPSGELTHADPPLHTRLRNAVRREFGVTMVRQNLEPLVRAKVKRLIAGLSSRAEVDFAKEIALELPAAMVCGWLGFPESDHPQLLAWWGAMLERTPGQVALPAGALTGRDAMRAYLRDAITATC